MLFLRNVFNLSFIRLERVFSIRTGEEYSSEKGRRRELGACFSSSHFALSRGNELTLLEVLRETFCVLSGAGTFMLLLGSKPINGPSP